MTSPQSYLIICWLFPKLLGIIYLIVFIPLLFQIRGLIGKEGILPLPSFLAATKWLKKRRFYRL